MANIQVKIHLIVDGIFSLYCIGVGNSVSSGKNGIVIFIKSNPTDIVVLSVKRKIVNQGKSVAETVSRTDDKAIIHAVFFVELCGKRIHI